MQSRLNIHFPPAQKGAALVISMVMLLVITVIGIAVMGGSRLEWLMANNSHVQTDAYRNAEIALDVGLNSITNPPTSLYPPISSGPTFPPQNLADVTKWSDGTVTGTPVATASGSAAYVMEYLGCSQYDATTPQLTFANSTCIGNPATNIFAYVYQVWALGTDGKGAARILLSTRTLINNQVSPPFGGLPAWTPGPTPLPTLNNRVELLQ